MCKKFKNPVFIVLHETTIVIVRLAYSELYIEKSRLHCIDRNVNIVIYKLIPRWLKDDF